MSADHSPVRDRAVRLEKVLPSGWSLNMHLVPLGRGRLLVYGPTWLGADTFTQVERYGEPAVIVAPNHFHHLSLTRFRERYPKAASVAHEGALPRLLSKGHRGLIGSAQFSSAPGNAGVPEGVPPGVELVACEGTKSGELWLTIRDETATTLLVGDAFFNVTRDTTGIVGLALRLLQTAPGLSIGSTWRWLQLSDRERYVAWALELLGDTKPTRLCVCHGEDFESDDLVDVLTALIQRRLG
jgi:hypothetical protein